MKRYRFVPNRRFQSTPSYREMSSIRLLARRAFSRAPAAEARAFSAETAVGGTPGAMTHRNLGNNVIVGGTIFSFVGAVYWYTVHSTAVHCTRVRLYLVVCCLFITMSSQCTDRASDGLPYWGSGTAVQPYYGGSRCRSTSS